MLRTKTMFAGQPSRPAALLEHCKTRFNNRAALRLSSLRDRHDTAIVLCSNSRWKKVDWSCFEITADCLPQPEWKLCASCLCSEEGCDQGGVAADHPVARVGRGRTSNGRGRRTAAGRGGELGHAQRGDERLSRSNAISIDQARSGNTLRAVDQCGE